MGRAHRNLDVWKSAMTLVSQIYGETREFPNAERYGLVQQMRRAAVSVPSNIAEGAGHGSDAQFKRFLYMARGSLTELDTQIEIATSLNYLSSADAEELFDRVQHVGRMLSGLIRKLERDIDER